MSNNTNKPKSKRFNIGSIVKAKKAKPGERQQADYIKIRSDLKEPLVLNAGDYLSVETVDYQKQNLQALVADGILTQEKADESLNYIEQNVARRKEMNEGQDFVRADVFYSKKS